MTTTINVTNNTTNNQRLELIPIADATASTTAETNPTLDITGNVVNVCLVANLNTNISCAGAPAKIDALLVAGAPSDFELTIEGEVYTSGTLSDIILQSSQDVNCPLSILPKVTFGEWEVARAISVPKDNLNQCTMALRYTAKLGSAYDGIYTFSGNDLDLPPIDTPAELIHRINDWLKNNSIPAEFRIFNQFQSGQYGNYYLQLQIRYDATLVGAIVVQKTYQLSDYLAGDATYSINAGLLDGTIHHPNPLGGVPPDYLIQMDSTSLPDYSVTLTPFDTVNGDTIQLANGTWALIDLDGHPERYPDSIILKSKASELKPSPYGGMICNTVEIIPRTTEPGYLRVQSLFPAWQTPPLFTTDVSDPRLLNTHVGVLFPNGSIVPANDADAGIGNYSLAMLWRYPYVIGPPISPLTLITTQTNALTPAQQNNYSIDYDNVMYFRYVLGADVPAWIARSLTYHQPNPSTTTHLDFIGVDRNCSLIQLAVGSDQSKLKLTATNDHNTRVKVYYSIDALICDTPDYIANWYGASFNNSMYPIEVPCIPARDVYVILSQLSTSQAELYSVDLELS